MGTRRRRDLPPGRDPPQLHGRLLRGGLRGGEGGRPGDPRPRLLRARGLAGRGHARARARRLPVAPTRCRPRLASGNGSRDPRRRGPAGDLPGQGDDEAVAARPRHGAPRRPALDDDDHVRARRPPPALGTALPSAPRAAATHGRLHRDRAAALRAHGGADLPQGSRAPGADLPRGDPAARRRAARAPSLDHERAGLVGEARSGRRAGRSPRGGERPGWNADERVHLARRRLRARPGAAARADGGGDQRDRSHASPADDAVRGSAARAGAPLLRRGASQRAAQPERERRRASVRRRDSSARVSPSPRVR